MATYKVIQDIEAEDKLFGPLTLRQFIYGCIAALCLYLTYLVVTKGAPFMAGVFLPVAVAMGFFAWPWGRDQPTEIWALAKIRFMIKPRRRIWNQSGIKELVTITVPKKVEKNFTNGLSESEVRTRLQVLANTIDSRGWAIKNINMYGRRTLNNDQDSDRLINMSALPQEVSNLDIRDSDDILDANSNPVAQQFEDKIAAAERAHREQIMQRMQQAATPPPPAPAPQPPAPAAPTAASQTPSSNDYWFLNQPAQTATSIPGGSVTFNTQVVTPGAAPASTPVSTAVNPTPDEEELVRELDEKNKVATDAYTQHLHTIQPLSAQHQAPVAAVPTTTPASTQPTIVRIPPPQKPQAAMTEGPDTAILDLVKNDDFNVATIAREANKRKESPPDEVVISLH